MDAHVLSIDGCGSSLMQDRAPGHSGYGFILLRKLPVPPGGSDSWEGFGGPDGSPALSFCSLVTGLSPDVAFGLNPVGGFGTLSGGRGSPDFSVTHSPAR